MSSSSAFAALPVVGYAITALCVSYIFLRVWRYSRARLSAKVSLPQPVSSAKESFSLAKSTSWNWNKWTLPWLRSWSKPKPKPAAILDSSRDNSVELLPTTGLPPPPTPPPLVDLATPTASAGAQISRSTRTPSPTQHHKHVAHQLYSRPASPHAFLATTSPSKVHKRSKSLGGVPVRRLSSGTNSALRNAFPTPSTPPPDFDHEMREIASSSNSRVRDQILIDFSSSGSSEEDDVDVEARVSPAASDIGVLPSHVFMKPRPSPVPLVDFPQSDVGTGIRGRQPAMDDMDGWRWFKSPALASFGQHTTQKVAAFASTTASAIGVHAWASRSTSSLAETSQSTSFDNEMAYKPLPLQTFSVGSEKGPSGSGPSTRLVDVDVDVMGTPTQVSIPVPMPQPVPFKLPPPPSKPTSPDRLVDVELPLDQITTSPRVPSSSRHVKNVSDVFHHPLEELVDVLAVPMVASKPLASPSAMSMPNSPSPPFALPAQQAVAPMSIARGLSLPLEFGATQPSTSMPIPQPIPVPVPSKVSIAIPTPDLVMREIIDTPIEPLIPVVVEDSQPSTIGEEEVGLGEDSWSWGMDEVNHDPWADHVEIPDEADLESEKEREDEHDSLIDLEREDAEREMELEGFTFGREEGTPSPLVVVEDDAIPITATTPQKQPLMNFTNITTFNDYAPLSSEKEDLTVSDMITPIEIESSWVAGSTIDIAPDAEKENQNQEDQAVLSSQETEEKEVVDEVEEDRTPRATPAQAPIDLPAAPLISPTVTSFSQVAGLMELELSHQYQYSFADPPSPVILYDDDAIESLSLDSTSTSYFPDPDLLPLPSPTKVKRFEVSMPSPPPSAQFGVPTFAQSSSSSFPSETETLIEEEEEDGEVQYALIKPSDEASSPSIGSIPHIQTPTPPASPPPSSKAFALTLDTASMLSPPSIAPIARGNKGKAGRSLPPSPRMGASKSLSPISTSSSSVVQVNRVVAPMAISRARSEGANLNKTHQETSALWAGEVAEEMDDGQNTPVANKPLWSIRAENAPVLGLGSVQSSPVLARRAEEKEKVVEVEAVKEEERVGEKEKVEEKKVEEEAPAPVPVAIERTSSLPGTFPEASNSSTTLASSISTSSDATLTASDSSTSTAEELNPTPAATATIAKPRTGPSVRAIVRSPIEIALAMQLRPGLGLGADPAWMVRFLMSMFGWFAVLVSGQAEYY